MMLVSIDIFNGETNFVKLTETWLNPENVNSDLLMPGYEILQRVRVGLAYVTSSLGYDLEPINAYCCPSI